MSWGKFIDTAGLFGAYLSKKTEENDRLLLLFLFGFIYSVEIDGCSYSVDQNLYENDCIASKQPKVLLYFLTHFTIPDIEDPDFIPL